MKNKRWFSLFCAMTIAVISVAQPAYAAAHSCGILQEPGSEEKFEEMDYEVLKTDEKGRQLLARIGDVYVTSEYNDENKSSVTYYSNGPLAGDSYTQKITTQEIEENEFHSVSVITDETAEGTVVEEYDKDDNLTRKISRDGRVEVNEYDADGNLLKTIFPYQGNEKDRLHAVYYEYDKDGHMILSRVPQAENGDGSIAYRIEKYAYDKEGNMVSYEKNVNAVGETEQYVRTDYKYADGRLVQTTEYDTDGSVLTIAQYVYDADGNMVRQYTGLTDPLTIRGLDDVVAGADTEYDVASYEYEDGQLVKEGDSDGNTITYEYNEDGLLSKKTDKDGSRYEYTYRDGMYRESEKIFYAGNDTDTPDEVREYIQELEEDGSCGMLTEIKEDDVSTYYSYDEKGMLIKETDPNGNTIAYEYDEDENITGISVTDKKNALVGETVYRYDGDGKLFGIENGDGDKIADIYYDENGNVEKETYGNGSVAEYGYYENGLPSEVVVSVKDDKKQVDLSYEYSVDGQMHKKADNLSGEKTEYHYDGMGRLEGEKYEEDGTETTVGYTYDDASNLLQVNKDGVTEMENTYGSDNRLEASDDGNAEYDAGGNLIRLGDVAYTYDVRNRLVQVDTKEHTVRYGYDMNDKLISRNVDGTEEQFVWANDTLVAKLGKTNTYYHTDLGENVKASEEGESVIYYLEENSRGDVIALMDKDANLYGEKEYRAFGTQRNADENTEFTHGYTGALYDNATHLVYLEARFYLPEQGIFLTEDTVKGDRMDAATLNRYIYCTQDPVNKIDRSGHWGKDRHTKITNAALAANGYTDATMTKCVNDVVAWADLHFHYDQDHIYNLVWSEQSKKRVDLKNLKGYCDQGKYTKGAKTKKNRYGSPYHGRGDYYNYLAYLLGLSLQFKKGYQITNLTLRNDNEIFQQINFDTLIHLSGRYETQTGKNVTRNIYSYLILGLALHLAEDLWAHVAVVDDSASVLREYKALFKDVENLITVLSRDRLPITYLNLYDFAISGNYDALHKALAEGTRPSANAREGIAQQSATRLIQFYKNGRIMYSGNKTLTGATSANTTDASYLKRLQCPNFYFRGSRDNIYARYICSACDGGTKDSCYLFFYRKTGADNGLGYREILPGDYK